MFIQKIVCLTLLFWGSTITDVVGETHIENIETKLHGSPSRFKTDGLDCGERLIAAGDVFSLKSANYPKRYPSKNDCVWKFKKSSPDVILRLRCDAIHIRRKPDCRDTWIRVKDGRNLDRQLCGRYLGLAIDSRGNSLEISFHSRSRQKANSFYCKVTGVRLKSDDIASSSRNTTNSCPVCGTNTESSKKKSAAQDRIVGGQAAANHSHPYLGGLVNENETSVWCGAVLISDQYLLTAAHCAKNIHLDEQEVNVILGTNRVSQGDKGQQRIPVARVVIHERYNPLNLDNDIALLELQRPAVLGPTVHPICLITEDIDYTGVMAITTGWGKLSEGGHFPETLQEVEIEVVDNEVCVEVYTADNVNGNHVCAGGNGTDACQADSGGPLIVEQSDGTKALLGITSWGRGCGRIGIPGVYVKVFAYLDWISSKVNKDPCKYLAHLPSPVQPSETSNHTCACGQRNNPLRIVGGHPTKVHEFPWQVAIVDYFGITPFCGAVIISSLWVLTAAHCALEMHHGDQLLLGEHNWRKATETRITIRVSIAKVIPHPNHNTPPLDNDLALLELSDPINFSLYHNAIAPVCLPPPGRSFEGETAIVSGWGLVKFGGTQSEVLRAVEIPIMSQSDCMKNYGTFITKNMICGGYPQGRKDACQGDSGGPLVVDNGTGNYVLAGIVSWGYRCAFPGYPGVYAKVNNYLSWISNYIEGTDTCQNN
ncbi:transmembrane protease serine 9-like [Palaemon carinicauda]|uniref:transmembrane protease serine 9-like n=1 Tax=Palaemon carinicauda TaxID=392227 RepID=UPI0035B69D49